MGAPQTPNFRSQQAADLSSLSTQQRTAENLVVALQRALAGNGPNVKDILRGKGKLSNEEHWRIGKERYTDQRAFDRQQSDRVHNLGLSLGLEDVGAAGSGGFKRRIANSERDIRDFEHAKQRSDLANIFGRNLSQAVGHASLNSGSVPESAPKRNALDRFSDGVQEFLSGIF